MRNSCHCKTTSAIPTRSQLFIPGPRSADWFDKAIAAGTDAVIFDLEDATPLDGKQAARTLVADIIRERICDDNGPVQIVRVNGSDSPHFLDDVLAVVEAGAAAVMLPKTHSADDVIALDALITAAERRCQRTAGSTLIVPLLETPTALRDAYKVGISSNRVAYMGALSANGGDVEREVGFRWTREGTETLTFRSHVLLDARAANISNPVTGLWTDIDDLDGLRRFAEQSRDIGYDGMMVIHPSHVAIVNDVFTPTEQQRQNDHRLVEAMEAALADGKASIRIDGKMADVAMLNSAKNRLKSGHPSITATSRT